MGGLDFRLPCGRCQLYRCSQSGSSAARRSECGIGLGVGPFAQRGLDEALGLAVGLGRVGPGADVLEAEIAAGLAEGLGAIAGAVVGHHARHLDAEAREVGDGGWRKATALSFRSSGRICEKARREASSIATWTNSQPAPRLLLARRDRR